MGLREYWKSLSPDGRNALAERCETTTGHLTNVAYGTRSCSVKLAVALERETNGKFSCESLRPNFDWAYLRGSLTATPPTVAKRKRA